MMRRRPQAMIVVILSGLMASLPSCRAEALPHPPDLGQLRPGPAPKALLGLWARGGGRCQIRNEQVRITPHTVQYNRDKPLYYWYYSGDPHPDQGMVFTNQSGHPGFIYDSTMHNVFEGETWIHPARIYYPCSGPAAVLAARSPTAEHFVAQGR